MAPTPLKRLSKPKTLKGLSGLGRTQKLPPLPDLAQPGQLASVADDELSRLTDTLGDRTLAKKLLNLRKKFPDATMPELVTMEFLDRRAVRYQFQKWLLGGRSIRGGQIVDFALDMGTHTLIWEVMGNYWHTRPGQAQLDEGQKHTLLGLSVFGKPVRGVVSLWESRLMSKYQRKGALEMAMAGVELGR